MAHHTITSALGFLTLVLLLPAGAPASAEEPTARQPQVVVAVADTGVNPYHEIYYRPENTDHPCTWVEGFDDCSIPALELSIGEYDDYATAVATDQAVWSSVELHQWYWIPKTNIIGAVCEGSGSLTTSVGTCILDGHGHGTGTTSSVLSEAPDALLLVHEGNSGAYDLATAPVTPDIQTHSWGPAAPLPLHAADPVLPGESLVCDDQAFDKETIFFISAGNEAPWPAIADCSRVHNRVQIVGGGYPGHWETRSWSTYDFASWMCRPTAVHNSTTGTRPSYCGTSFASPTAAGAAAAALLAIRRHDGFTQRSTPDMVSATVSRERFIDALRTAATYTPQRKFPNPPSATSAPLPAEAPYLIWGYGWLDGTVADVVVTCALGRTCPEKSAAAQEHNARRRAMRSATTDDAVPGPAQDDGGSGRDAGTTRATAVRIGPGAHTGYLWTAGPFGDYEDWYAFDTTAGTRIRAEFEGVLGCWQLLGPDGAELASTCTVATYPTGPDLAAPTDGTYVLTFGRALGPQDYRFSLALQSPD